jgi:acetoin utilization protein AcuB
MLVRNWMTPRVITIDVDDPMVLATQKLKEHNIRKLPVTRKDKLVGIVTDRDLKRASASDASTLEVHELFYLLSKIKVKDIMTKDPITVPFDYTIEETAQVLLENRISGVPVVDHEGKITGIITEADLFRALMSLTGLVKRGVQYAFQLEDRPGSIKDITDVMRKYGGRLASILTSYDGAPEGYRKVYIRIYGIDRHELGRLSQELKETTTLLYMVDHGENKREVFLL